MKYTGMRYWYTLTQLEKECIVIDNIKGPYAKPEQNVFQKNQLNRAELYMMIYRLKLKLVNVFPLNLY